MGDLRAHLLGSRRFDRWSLSDSSRCLIGVRGRGTVHLKTIDSMCSSQKSNREQFLSIFGRKPWDWRLEGRTAYFPFQHGENVMSRTTKKIAAACFALALMGGFASPTPSAHAGDICYEPHCVYKTVTTWVTTRVPFQRKITLYKPCGTPYYVWKTFYKTVKVPVTHRVKVCY